MPKLIYLDSAATSLQKPPQVGRAMMHAMRTMGSPGRGGHRPAMLAADTAYACRSELAALFGVGEPERVVFTMNATHGLNIALSSLVTRGDRVVVSGYEHNAVMRPLHLLGAEIDVAASPLFAPDAAIDAFRKRLRGAKAAVVCHVSNVFGYILPLAEIASLCRMEGVPLLVDASQSAGCLPLDFDALGLQFAAMPGHKGLLGPQGTGVLLCGDRTKPLMAGGTGSDSLSMTMPDYLPDQLEAGTHNITGIAGLLEGVRWVKRKTSARILQHEQHLLERMTVRLRTIDGLELFTAPDLSAQAGVLSCRMRGADCELLAQRLGDACVAIRSGYHCAPLAHENGGTLDTGTMRFSFSPFNTEQEIDAAAKRLSICVKDL